MTTVRELALSELATRLAAMATARGYAFERNRIDEVPIGEMPAILQIDGGLIVTGGDSGGIRRDMRVEVEAYCTAASGELLGAEISAVHGAIVSAARPSLAGLSLDGNALDVREISMTNPDFEGTAHAPVASFAVVFTVEFETDEFDPETPS